MLILGDNLEVMPTLPEASQDCIITSPPYNFKKNYHGPSDRLPWPIYWKRQRMTGEALLRLARPGGVLFLVAGSNTERPLHSVDIARCYEEAGWILQKRIIWQKSNEEGKGHFTPLPGPFVLNSMFEDVYLFRKGRARVKLDRLALGVPYSDPTNTTRWAHGAKTRCRGDIWFIPYKTIQSREKDRGGHEATFPEELAVRCLKLVEWGRTLDVMDPYCGSGTVPVAAARRGHRVVGIEQSPVAMEGAQEALDALQAKTAEKSA